MARDEIIVVDSGVSTAAGNIAVDRAWLAAHGREGRDNLLRFHRSGASVWLGIDQFADREVRLDYCAHNGLPVVRRLTGGGVLYVDEGQFCWTLIVPRQPDGGANEFADMHRRAAQALADGLASLGVYVTFKVPNDLEIDGRKLASCFATLYRDSVLVHGTLLMDVDVGAALHALRVPTEKLSSDGLAGARQRLTTLREQREKMPAFKQLKRAVSDALVAGFGLRVRKATKSVYAVLRDVDLVCDGAEPWLPAAEPAVEQACKHPAEALFKTAGGLLRARLEVDAQAQRVRNLDLAGDVFAHPSDLFHALGRDAVDVAVADLPGVLEQRLHGSEVRLQGCTARDVIETVKLAVDRLDQRLVFGFSAEQANRLMVLGQSEGLGAREILNRAGAMLVPYCAKPLDCKWRNRDGCTECGQCSVGRAYQLGRVHGMRVVSINNYEHLCRTLGDLRAAGVQGLVGMCCQGFFIKRNRAFVDSNIPMVLMDISGSNCYELGQEEQAYAGTFAAVSHLDIPVLERVMHYVPLHGGQTPSA